MPKNLDTIDTGSNYSFTEKLIPPGNEIARSAFNLSHLHTTTINNAGELIPIGLIETVPGDSFELNVQSLVRVLPQVVPLYSRQRLYIHAFYSRNGDLWKNWHTFMTKGYSGRVVKEIPNITSKDAFATHGTCGQNGNNDIQQGSLMDYFGLPIKVPNGAQWTNLKYKDYKDVGEKISLLPFMMYQRIYKDYYMNPNYYIGNENWFPDNDEDFRLDDNGKVISNTMASNADHQIPGVSFSTLQVDLYAKRFRDYTSDYFTSAVPFPQRGDTPTLNASLAANVTEDLPLKIIKDFSLPQSQEFNYELYPGVIHGSGSSESYRNFKRGTTIGAINKYYDDTQSQFILPDQHDTLAFGILSNDIQNVFKKVDSTITLNQLRELAVAQIELEKMARTDGSYKEFGLTFFNQVSKNAVDHRPQYIGGAYQSLVFSEVLQTSQTSTQAGNESVLGSYAGHGISASQDGYIGRVDCDDYGYIMIIASIMPDVYYHQGINKMWTRSTQDDMYLPNRARLGLTHILNKELMWTKDNNSNEGLFAYQTPYDELRYQANRISGKIADPENLSFYPYTQARTFKEVPTYSQSFAQANQVRKDYLAGDSAEVAYTAQFSLGIRAVRPLPYNPEPAQILN